MRTSLTVVLVAVVAFTAGWLVRDASSATDLAKAPVDASQELATTPGRARPARTSPVRTSPVRTGVRTRIGPRVVSAALPVEEAVRRGHAWDRLLAPDALTPDGLAPDVLSSGMEIEAGRFVALVSVPGFEKELTRGDWRTLGEVLRRSREVRSLERVQSGDRELSEDEAERLDWLDDWVSEGLEYLPGDLVGVLGAGPNDVLVHPAVTVNLMVALLEAEGLSASADARVRLAEIGRRWSERERLRQANESSRPHASFLRHVVDRVALREAFLDEAFSALTSKQQTVLRPPLERGLLGSDHFSAAPLILTICDSVWSLSDQTYPVGVHLLHGHGPKLRGAPEGDFERARQIAIEWSEALPPAAFPVPAVDGAANFPTTFGRALLETQADLCDRWLRDGGLSEAADASLKEERELYLISRHSWATANRPR